MNKIIQAANFMRAAHEGQKRKGGEPYEIHPTRCAATVLLHPVCTEETVCAMLLHDTIEDCGITREQIERSFGTEIASLVYALTNPSKAHPELTRPERKLLDRNHLQDQPPVVKILKMIDRLDNVNDLAAASPEFIKLYIEETRLLLRVIGDADALLAADLAGALANWEHSLNLTKSLNTSLL